MKRPSKTLIVTITLVIFALVYAIFSSVRAAKQRVESVPKLPNSLTVQTEHNATNTDSVDYSKVSINAENVVQVVRELKRPQNFYYETTSELFANNKSSKYSRKTWKQGEWQRIDILSASGKFSADHEQFPG